MEHRQVRACVCVVKGREGKGACGACEDVYGSGNGRVDMHVALTRLGHPTLNIWMMDMSWQKLRRVWKLS